MMNGRHGIQRGGITPQPALWLLFSWITIFIALRTMLVMGTPSELFILPNLLLGLVDNR